MVHPGHWLNFGGMNSSRVGGAVKPNQLAESLLQTIYQSRDSHDGASPIKRPIAPPMTAHYNPLLLS